MKHMVTAETYIKQKVSSEKKSGTSHWEVSVSCTTQKYNNVKSPYPIFALLSVKWHGHLQDVKSKRNFKLLALKVVTVAYERWSLTRDSKYRDLTLTLLVFRKLVAEERWLLTRGGHNWRFYCNYKPWMSLNVVFHVSQTKLSFCVIPPSQDKSIVCDSQSVHLSTGHLLYCTCFKCINTSCEIIIRQSFTLNT